MRSLFSTLLFCTPLLVGAMILVGCNQSAPTDSAETADVSSKTANKVCPIMGGEVTAEGGTIEWNGKLIGFCCPGCEPKWEKLSDEEKSEKLAEAKANVEGEAAHPDHDHS